MNCWSASNRNPNGQGTLADFTNWSQNLGLPNPFGVTGWPTITAGSFPGNNWDADNTKNQNLTTYIIEDNLTRIMGKHTMTFGGSLRREYNNVRELQQAQGSHDFAESWTAQYDPAGDQAVSFTGRRGGVDGARAADISSPTSTTAATSISSRPKPACTSTTVGR